MVVPDEMEQRVDERLLPLVADHVRADDDVAELPRQAVRNLVEPVHREREGIGRLVDAEMLALQRAALLRPDERKPELARLDTLAREDAPSKVHRTRLVDLLAGAVVDVDVDHVTLIIGSVASRSTQCDACTPRRSAARACAARHP